MNNALHRLLKNLAQYKKKYYANQLIRGSILWVAMLLASYQALAAIEYYGNFNTYFRGTFLFLFIGLNVIMGIKWVAMPLYKLFHVSVYLPDEEAAKQIGKLLPDINDKLLNTLQLQQLSHSDNALIQAGIAQKSQQLSVFNFSSTIKLEENSKFLPYALIPLAVLGALLLFIPQLITEGTERIVKFNHAYTPKAPFEFVLENENLQVFKNDDIKIKLRLTGSSVPDMAYIDVNGVRRKMEWVEDGLFEYLFSKVDKSTPFYFSASGFNSALYQLELKTRPTLRYFDVKLNYPTYIGKKSEQLSNTGNLLVPEGTTIQWIFETEDCKKLTFKPTSEPAEYVSKRGLSNAFEVTKKVRKNMYYEILLENEFGNAQEKMEYSITVVPDEYPKISVEQFKDTTLFSFLLLGGNLSDDYGLTQLQLSYRVVKPDFLNFNSDFIDKPVQTPFKNISLAIQPQQNSQSFYYRWDIDTLQLQPGEKLEYYLTVWDNDAINGRKLTRSQAFELKLPTFREIEQSIAESSQAAEKQITSTLQKAENLKKEVKKLEQRLKNKKIFDWQDKKAIEDVLKKQEQLQNELKELQEKHQELSNKKDRFDKTNERIAEKTKLLQQLMNEMLDDETKKLYQELAKLLQEKNKEAEIKELVEKLKNKDQNLEKELDRALEMFKQLKFESKLDDIKQKMEQLAQKQEKLADKAEEKNANTDKLKEEQQKLNEEFEEVKKELEDLREMNEELENKNDLENTQQKEEEISTEQQKSQEALEKKDAKKAAKSQKNAAQKMKEMAQKFQQMQMSMEMQQLSENMEDLRAILENLLHLSHAQEEVMKEFKKVTQSDPRYITLSQQQLKLKDDSKVIEDSLNALAKRVFQIQSFIKRELEAMNNYMDESAQAIKARRADLAAGKQQFAMTSMNNLALMLSEVLQQMQQQMQEQKNQGSGKGQKSKKQKGNKPSLSQLQKELNKKIEDLKRSGLQGKQLSQELAKLAREQEQIRKALEEEGNQNTGKDGKNPQESGQGESEKIKKEMEKTEADLVNKQITQDLLNRQQEIVSRLLEHEKAQREREQDPKREAQAAKEKLRKTPPTFQQYLQEKEKQVELLRTISPALNPYYKKKASEYFENINR